MTAEASAADSEQHQDDDATLLSELLLATSRTFGLAIPLLPANLRADVTLAYLLFRIADTIEDGAFADSDEKLQAFQSYRALFEGVHAPSASVMNAAMEQLSRLRIENDDYLRLVRHLPQVINATQSLQPNVREVMFSSLSRSIDGMAHFVAQGDELGNVQLQSLEDVRRYCYAVAGIVGEMLTELFLQRTPELSGSAEELRARAKEFGEGLQLVNILKDSDDDQTAGRSFIASSQQRAELFELARSDLPRADEYVAILKDASADASLVAFCELPARLAWRTLELVEQSGPGAKVPRTEVAEMVADILGRATFQEEQAQRNGAAEEGSGMGLS